MPFYPYLWLCTVSQIIKMPVCHTFQIQVLVDAKKMHNIGGYGTEASYLIPAAHLVQLFHEFSENHLVCNSLLNKTDPPPILLTPHALYKIMAFYCVAKFSSNLLVFFYCLLFIFPKAIFWH